MIELEEIAGGGIDHPILLLVVIDFIL